jgi:predicted metal-dependent hydrolase
VASKTKWIRTKQQQSWDFDQQFKPIVVATGEELLFLGVARTILLAPILSPQTSEATVVLPENYDVERLRKWLKFEAKRVLTERAQHFSGLMGVSYTALKLSSAKTRWGSCSAKNSLNFSWRLILCPTDVIDYLVVHELAHILQKNHSPKYWQQVAAILPNYKQQQKWLKANRKIMDLI